ncbi:glycine/D-amino acid oxidase-like deaminating enzyme [Granulicella aggregans]|jgi:glycine/D-amino acid oxidase-like deaminating enzyme|uniref:Glycine/D-amino acid oxidase-like deaminating enzyme n=1 Tax=Granulicella aggregans TaxID=474949 RepID=A0A7W7ZE62_9BACT|nr:FAD-dependent oxidoreductase [Granulicella aggregans]MBB5057944.1 glycine/D-amino acid oxidase-like deaminating enzyme [Granulicella aggregans]
MTSFDVIILGAGIVGSACAMECAQAGLCVCVIEPSTPGGAATAAGMGHLVVMDDSPAQLALSNFSRTLWRELSSSLPNTVEYEQCGTLWVAADDEEMDEVQAKQQTYAQAGIRSEILNSSDLAQEEPNLRSGLAGGLLVPDDGVIYPPAASHFFLSSALSQGARLLRGKAAIALHPGSVKLEDGTTLAAKQIVVATGSDLRLLPSLPIQKRKGHLVITDRYPGFVRHQLVELGYLKSAHKLTSDSVAFNVQPRKTGQLLIGSSRQYGNDDPAVDSSILSAMIERAQSYMPRLADLFSIRVWTGFRAATPDKLPLIGPSSEPGIFLAVGFEGLGITNAPGAARLLTDHLLDRASDIDSSPFLPSRARTLEPSHA